MFPGRTVLILSDENHDRRIATYNKQENGLNKGPDGECIVSPTPVGILNKDMCQ